jgi:hypothetical protein
VEARPLAELAVPRLQRLGGVRVVDDRLHARADRLHLLEVGQLDRLGRVGTRGDRTLAHHDQQLADDVGPAVVDQVLGFEPPDTRLLKFSMRRSLPTGLERRRPLGVGRPVVAHVDRRRRALEDVELLRRLAEVGHALHGGGAGADDADPLVGQAGEAARRVAAGVRVVPAAGVERVALERLDAGDARQLRPVQRAVGHHHEPGAHRSPRLVLITHRASRSSQRSSVTSVWKQASR